MKLYPSGELHVTPHERRLIPLLLQDLQMPEIAKRLNLSPHTIRTYVDNMKSVLGVRTLQALALRLRDLGFDAKGNYNPPQRGSAAS